MKICFFAALLLPLSAFAIAIPGYLRPTHPAPTGHYHHEDLLSHTREYDEFEWLWVRTPAGTQGWTLKSSVLLPLDFSRKAVLEGSYLIYDNPGLKQGTAIRLKGERVVSVLSRKRRFYKITYKDKGRAHTGWVKDQHLQPVTKDAGYFIATDDVNVRSRPKKNGKVVAQFPAETRLIPVKVVGHWVHVRKGKLHGYVPLSKLKTRLDVASKLRTRGGYHKPHRKYFGTKIVEIFPNPLWVGTGDYTLDLKSQPDMSSKTVATLKPWASMSLRGHAVQRWGHSFLPGTGKVWWPAEFIESSVRVPKSNDSQAYKLPKKSILQELQSPLVKGLRFASTPYGIFRAQKGKYWRQVGPFKKGQPLTMSANGTLFVGDKVSFDHGESFKEYIRWDKVFEALPDSGASHREPIRIVQVAPQGKGNKTIYVSLKVGEKENYTLMTPDFGKSWKRL